MRYLVVFFVFMTSAAFGQLKHISGVVQSETGELVPYALVVDSLNNKAVYADNGGVFHFLSEKSELTLTLMFSHVSYKQVQVKLKIEKDTFLVVKLPALELQEVLVKGTSLSRQAMLGVSFLEGRIVQNIPSFFGEPDLVKSLTVLPGIASGLDLYSSIYVRGGNRDQNLFLVEGARYYTTSHAGGYLSLFNPEIIRHVEVYKGISPAKYGDGLSAVVDVKLIDGTTVPKANVDIGTMRSDFFLESKGSSKVYGFLAGRISQIDLISGSAFKEFKKINEVDEYIEFSKFNFWDFDGKLRYRPSVRTSIVLNGHLGNDESASYYQGGRQLEGYNNTIVNSVNGFYIANHNLTLNVNHLFPSGVSLKNTAWYTYYQMRHESNEDYFAEKIPVGTINFQNNTYVKDLTEKLELSIPISNVHYLRTGVQLTSFLVNPSVGKKEDEIKNNNYSFGNLDQHAIGGALFIDDDWQLFHHTTIKIGLRSSLLQTSDTSFFNWEPRVLLSREIASDWSLKAGYSRNSQAIHNLVQTYGYFEKESWILSNKKYEPQVANQFSGGIFGKIPGTTIDLSAEVYYKAMQHLLFLNPIGYDTKNMFDYIFNNGKGKSYGGEFLLQKTNGKIQWSIAYTLSWSKRKFESINNGEWFFSEYDRRHDMNIGFHYFSGKKNTWNLNYILQTGRPFTLPSAYVQQTSFFNGFYLLDGANNARMPAYKRFDISYKRKGTMLWGRKSELTFSVLNLFARKNPFSMYVKNGKLYMESMYRVIPSANLKFYLFKN